MKRLLSVSGLMLVLLTANSKSNDVSINLTCPGQLEETVDLLEITSIDKLTISGVLGAEDFKTLRAAKGKLSTVQTLDISDISLNYDESQCYAELYGGVNYISNTYTYYRYYISNNLRTEIEKGQTDLGVGTIIYHCYNNNLSALFNGTQAYKKIILPSIESIGDELVSGNNCVEEVVMKAGAKYIGTGAFAKTTALKQVVLPESIDSIGTNAFYQSSGDIIIQSHIKSVGAGAFRESKLNHFDFSSTEYLGEYAFYKSALSGSIDLSNVKKIPAQTFTETLIDKVILAPDITEIGEYAFYNSTLSNINIPKNNLIVGYRAFHNTPWYKNYSVTDSEGIIYIGSTAYSSNISKESSVREF